MGISEEEHIRRLTREKNDMGNTAKWWRSFPPCTLP